MPHSDKDVILNGVKYFLAEDAEGNHFAENYEQLRPSNTQLVQGENKYNLRPDVVVWSWTDWSGGAGQHKWDPQNPSRYFDGVGIDGWTRPGFISPAPYFVATKDSGGTNDISFATTNNPVLVLPSPGDNGALISTTTLYLWSTDRWAAGSAITGATTAIYDADSDEQYLWMVDANSIIRRTSAGTYSDFATDVTAGTDDVKAIVAMKDNVYVVYHDSTSLRVVEYVKSGTPPVAGTTIYTDAQFANATAQRVRFKVTKSHNRFYIAARKDFQRSTIIEIIPSNAAGGGYGREIGDLPMVVESLMWHAGLLYAYSKQGPQYSPEVNSGTMMYLQPLDGTYGVVDVLRRDDEALVVSTAQSPLRGWIEGAAAINLVFFAVQNDDEHGFLMLCDTISGAIHSVAAINGLSSSIVVTGVSLLPVAGVIFATENGKVYRLQEDRFQTSVPADGGAIDPYIISGWWDFGTLEEKIINSFRITAENVPTDWSVELEYENDEDGVWTSVGSIVAGEESKEIVLSSPEAFRGMHLRLNFHWTGGGVPTTLPVISNVEARVTMAQYLHTWDLLLSTADDRSHTGSSNKRGAVKMANLRTLAGTGASFTFVDHYSTDIVAGLSYKVVLDSVSISAVRGTEGATRVRLIEVS